MMSDSGSEVGMQSNMASCEQASQPSQPLFLPAWTRSSWTTRAPTRSQGSTPMRIPMTVVLVSALQILVLPKIKLLGPSYILVHVHLNPARTGQPRNIGEEQALTHGSDDDWEPSLGRKVAVSVSRTYFMCRCTESHAVLRAVWWQVVLLHL